MSRGQPIWNLADQRNVQLQQHQLYRAEGFFFLQGDALSVVSCVHVKECSRTRHEKLKVPALFSSQSCFGTYHVLI